MRANGNMFKEKKQNISEVATAYVLFVEARRRMAISCFPKNLRGSIPYFFSFAIAVRSGIRHVLLHFLLSSLASCQHMTPNSLRTPQITKPIIVELFITWKNQFTSQIVFCFYYYSGSTHFANPQPHR